MSNFNKVILAGNLTRDPDLKYTPKGTAVCKFGLAINRTWAGEDGQKREEVTFVDIDCFGKTADTVAKFFRKGGKILLEGRLKLDQWDDKQTGAKRSKLGVVMESFSFIGGARCDKDAPAAIQSVIRAVLARVAKLMRKFRFETIKDTTMSIQPEGFNIPAFPVVSDQSAYCGMSMRDYFAAAALPTCQKMVADNSDAALMTLVREFNVKRREEIASLLAYRTADAMLAAREKGQQ